MGLNDKDFELDDIGTGGITFDFQGYLFKVLFHWKLVVLSIGIGLVIAYFINDRKPNVYRLNALVSVESEQNPFFTANTSISFNWGGVSGKVGKVMTSLATRRHNALVVDSLQFYKLYLKQGKYRLINIYGNSPYLVDIDKSKGQVLGKLIEIKPIDESRFELYHNFESSNLRCQVYEDKSLISTKIPIGEFRKTFNYGDTLNLPFFNGVIRKNSKVTFNPEEQYFIRFSNFDNVVQGYQNSVSVSFFKGSSTVLSLAMTNYNKAKIVDYLNTTVAILARTELRNKNLYATNTIAFIDSSLGAVNTKLKSVNDEMNSFRKSNKIFDVSEEIISISGRLKELEIQQEEEKIKVNYLKNLESYLQNKSDYTKIAAPTSVGIEEGGLLNSINTIISLAIQRQNLEKTTREGSILLRQIDSQIDAEKNVAFELIKSTTRTNNIQLNTINNRIGSLEAELSKLPEEQQEFLKIQRKLDLNQESYNVYLAKRSEAAIVKAANVSDITMIDEAKDIGGGLVGPNRSLNYMMALMVGFFLPLFVIFIRFLLDNTIHGTDEVERISKIPVIGVIGKYKYKNNLVAFEKPKSAVSESFRGIRSSLQFLFNNQVKSTDSARTLMLTSSVSGEGKTFCSINLATVYALSGKKTIILGLDLRRPKIFDDFNITNDFGMVNYLINDKTLDEVTYHTHIENLDVIPSGPVPPNPSELLMSEHMENLMTTLKSEYDIIVLDTPPVGLVTDALELTKYADATIFMIRLDYTKKGMLGLVNSKYKKGELKNVSFLLNFYKHKSNNNYGYSYGYGYGYGYGAYGNSYHENERSTSLISRVKKMFKRN